MIEHLIGIFLLVIVFAVWESYAFYTRKYGKAAPDREYTISEGVWWLERRLWGRVIVWGFLAWVNTHFLFHPGAKVEVPMLFAGMLAAVAKEFKK